ncbi:MAG: peptidylprolyl isomerase [Ilumatobacter sp.]
MIVSSRHPARRRLAVGVVALGLVAAACGDSDADVVSDQSESASSDTQPTDDDETGTTGDGDADVTDATAVTVVEDDAAEGDAAEDGAAVDGLGPIDGNCEPLPDTDEPTRSFDAAPSMCLEDGAVYTATVTTSAGTITIDLDQSIAPETVNSFVFLARNNYFGDTVCHRIIEDFVVQCGDPTATGTGGPGYSFPDELPAAGQYEVGSIAMANSGPDTNGSQFFIITGASGVQLPPLYNLFGQVPADDLGVVETMNSQASVDPSGVPPATELRIESVRITQS